MNLKTYNQHLKARNNLSDQSLEITRIYCGIWFAVIEGQSAYSPTLIIELEALVSRIAKDEWGDATITEFNTDNQITISSGKRIETIHKEQKQ